MKHRIKNRAIAYSFCIPAMALFIIVAGIPAVMSVGYSFTDWTGITTNINYIGLANYARLFRDSTFGLAVKNTFFITIVVVILQNICGVLLALAMNDRRIRGRGFLKTIYFLPSLLSVVVICYTWLYILNVHVGLLGTVLKILGIKSVVQYDIFLKPFSALLAIALTLVWQFSGYNMVIYLAGLQAIPNDLYESASIDGAKSTSRFFKITLPLLMPSVTVNMLLNIIGCLKIFEQVYIMTKGGPGVSTTTIGTYIYNSSLSASQFGYSTAISTVLFFIVLVVAVAQVRFTRAREVEI